jgi:hypothetical protein
MELHGAACLSQNSGNAYTTLMAGRKRDSPALPRWRLSRHTLGMSADLRYEREARGRGKAF